MDAFLQLRDIYLSMSRWKVIARIYGNSRILFKITMWGTKILFLIVAPLGFVASSWHPYFAALLMISAIWAFSFHKARAEVFDELYRTRPKPMKYFSKNYQYIRYSEFKKNIETNFLTERAREALLFANTINDPHSRSPITSHPLITFMLGAILAILSGAAGRWPMKYTIDGIMILMFSVYFLCMVLDITQTPTSDLKEFRLFLLWASEQPEGYSTATTEDPSTSSSGLLSECVISARTK